MEALLVFLTISVLDDFLTHDDNTQKKISGQSSELRLNPDDLVKGIE